MSTPDHVTDKELEEIARLDAAATPGPWVVSGAGGDEPNVMHREEGHGFFTVAAFRGWDRRAVNAAFVAAARTLLQKLAAEVVALRAERDVRRELTREGDA